MSYRVNISAKAEQDLDRVLAWFHDQRARAAGRRWIEAIWKAIDTLERNPQRCPLAIEFVDFELPVHELLFGRKPAVYRILFQVRKQTVDILRVWHSARAEIQGEDL